MTAKQDAGELFDKMLFCYQGHIDEYTAKQCALIAVDELLRYSKAHGFIGLTEHYEQVKIEIVNNTTRKMSAIQEK